MLLTAGHRGDGRQFIPVLAGIRVPRCGGGRPRTRPDRVLADRAYTSWGKRANPRRGGIAATTVHPLVDRAESLAVSDLGDRLMQQRPRPLPVERPLRRIRLQHERRLAPPTGRASDPRTNACSHLPDAAGGSRVLSGEPTTVRTGQEGATTSATSERAD